MCTVDIREDAVRRVVTFDTQRILLGQSTEQISSSSRISPIRAVQSVTVGTSDENEQFHLRITRTRWFQIYAGSVAPVVVSDSGRLSRRASSMSAASTIRCWNTQRTEPRRGSSTVPRTPTIFGSRQQFLQPKIKYLLEQIYDLLILSRSNIFFS
jgi:hypothetical protein